jgi:hypothetical protein
MLAWLTFCNHVQSYGKLLCKAEVGKVLVDWLVACMTNLM